jgi:hypothetical protein
VANWHRTCTASLVPAALARRLLARFTLAVGAAMRHLPLALPVAVLVAPYFGLSMSDGGVARVTQMLSAWLVMGFALVMLSRTAPT